VIVRVGDLEIEAQREADKVRVAVRGIYGLETKATDDEVMNLARSLTNLVRERVTT